MEYVKKALLLTEISEYWRDDFKRRKERLEKNMNKTLHKEHKG